MKRDWMSTGRRPTGLCGAALLLAARAYNMNRTIADIVRIVHISESVVRKRLDEFASTPSSALTIDEFATVDLVGFWLCWSNDSIRVCVCFKEESEDPPAFQESKKKVRDDPKRIKEDMQAECVSKDVIIFAKSWTFNNHFVVVEDWNGSKKDRNCIETKA